MSRSVFISYSRKDSEFVKKLALDLEDRGVTVWFDRTDLHAGVEWRAALEDNIKGCRAFVLVISPDSAKSEYVSAELDWAIEHDRPIIPLFYRKTKLKPALENRISENQYLLFTQGGYAQNFVDLANGLIHLNVPVVTDENEIAERRRQRLGAPVDVRWGQVFFKSFGWAAAWGLGWAVYWAVFIFLAALLNSGELEGTDEILLLPVSGLFGGFGGGWLAGLFTMYVLRHHAGNIGWKHMKASISIWGIFAPMVTIGASLAAGAIFFALNTVASSPCDGGFVDCLGQGFGEIIGFVIIGVLVALLWGFLAIIGIGALAGRRAVRHIRKLEPGILGKQAVWVVIGWAIGGGVAIVASFAIMSIFES